MLKENNKEIQDQKDFFSYVNVVWTLFFAFLVFFFKRYKTLFFAKIEKNNQKKKFLILILVKEKVFFTGVVWPNILNGFVYISLILNFL